MIRLAIGKQHRWIIFSVLIIIACQVYINWYGIGMTYDSDDYLNASQHVRDFLLKNEINGKVINRPPFYPVVLAILSFGNSAFVPVLQTLFFISSFLLYDKLLKEVTSDSVLRIGGYLVFALSLPLYINHSFIWTESLYMLLVLAQVVLLLKYRTEEIVIVPFLGLLLLGALSVLTKRGGILMLPGIAVSFALILGLRRGIPLGAIYFAICYFALAAWEAYMGRMVRVSVSVGMEDLQHLQYFDVLSSWMLPLTIPFSYRLIILLTFLAFIFKLFFLALRGKAKQMNVITTFGIIFFAYFILRWKYSPIYYHEADRYLSVGFPFFLLFVTGVSNIFVQNAPKWRALVLTFFLLWVAYSAVRLSKNAKQFHDTRYRQQMHTTLPKSDVN